MKSEQFKSDGSRYSSIIVPFNRRWRTPIEKHEIKAVFRKKGPSDADGLRTIYAYVGSPVSAICAKMEVVKTMRLSVEDARNHCEAAKLSVSKLEEYAGGQPLFVFEIGEITLPKTCLDRHELLTQFGFQPTPSFVALSVAGADALDAALGILSQD
tara:strand:- start:4349 stop:4816 length:468 start_codon:yes stop_codon:yes gene_type:complete